MVPEIVAGSGQVVEMEASSRPNCRLHNESMSRAVRVKDEVLSSLPFDDNIAFTTMCHHDQNGTAATPERSEMVSVDGPSTPRGNPANGINGHAPNVVNGRSQRRQQQQQPRNPYAPRYADFLSNVSNFSIIESTLRGARAPCECGLPQSSCSGRGRAVCERLLRHQDQDRNR